MVAVRGNTTARQIRDFERQMRDLGSTRIPRAVQFALNGVAFDAVKRSVPMLTRELEDPTTWITRGFAAQRGDLQVTDLDDVESRLVVKDQQSAVFKYMLSDDETQPIKREPGDVGPAENYNLVPIWPGIQARSKVKKNAKGNLPKTALSRLFAGTGTPAGTFWGRPTVMGQQRDLGLWSRPKRVGAGNEGLPVMLVSAKDETEHEPILNRPVHKIAEDAMETLPQRLETDLSREIHRRSNR